MATDRLATPTEGPLRRRGRGTVLVLLAAVCFGSSGPLGKAAIDHGLSAGQVASARLWVAAVVLVVGCAVVKPSLLMLPRGHWPLTIAYGLLGVFAVQLCYFLAVARIPVGIAILLEFTSPILVALWTRFVRKVRLPVAMWGGIVTALLGLAMVAEAWQGFRLDAVGVLFGLGSMVCSASYFLLGEHGAVHHDPAGLVVWGMAIGAVAIGFIWPPWTLPIGIVLAPAALGPAHPPVWALLVTIAVISTVLAYLLGMRALRHLPSSVASVVGLVEPAWTVLLAWLLLDERLDAVQLVGAAVLLAGAFAVQLTGGRVIQPEPLLPDQRGIYGQN